MPHDYGFYKYVTVAEKKAKAQKNIEKLRKKNPDIRPITVSGRKLAKTWWGIAWNDNLERYSDYANRLDRGRSYVRHGAILDLKISSGRVEALVQGSTSKPYAVNISIDSLLKSSWERIVKSCEDKINSLQELTDGKFPQALGEVFTKQGSGLFPTPKEISFSCNCPDWAVMCKHVAAVLYGIGVRLDENPSLFFVMRDVNIDEIISKSIKEKSQDLLKKSRRRSKRAIEDGDISTIFGIEVDEE